MIPNASHANLSPKYFDFTQCVLSAVPRDLASLTVAICHDEHDQCDYNAVPCRLLRSNLILQHIWQRTSSHAGCRFVFRQQSDGGPKGTVDQLQRCICFAAIAHRFHAKFKRRTMQNGASWCSFSIRWLSLISTLLKRWSTTCATLSQSAKIGRAHV